LFKKTKIIMPLISFLIEISLIDKQLLIVAYGMGIVNEDFKLLVERKKSKMIMDDVQRNYEKLWDRIYVN
jgi:hypothetical protein